ncbi:aspartate kinase, partial [bacterium]|nr:aspartate kinase [bacterium]
MTPARNPAEQPILVRKYGGTSIASVERIGAVAGDLVAKKQEGYRLVVVVSAMGHHTDELEHLARSVAPQPPRRELDLLLSVGERISMTLLSMALQAHGCSAISFTGSQCGLITDCSHTEACILEVKGDRVREALAAGHVVVVAGFQGVSRDREVTTLGRGGSDATAVALAAALGAERCEILKDVDGVFTGDPHRLSGVRRYDTLTYEELATLADAGCEVVHPRAVDYARRHGVPLFIGSSFHDTPGTRVMPTAATPE